MRKLLKYFTITTTCLLLVCASAFAWQGPHRALFPTYFGLYKIAPGIYTDKPEQADDLLKLVAKSRQTTKTFFGENLSTPRMILCATDDCTKIFSDSPVRGIAYGSHLLRVTPKGLNETIITHELTHNEVFKRVETLGIFAALGKSIPAWFNEGLAVYLSKDERFTDTPNRTNMRWALSFETYGNWQDQVNSENWRDAYGGSYGLLLELHEKIGDKGLKKLIDDVVYKGKDFAELTAHYLAFNEAEAIH